MEKEQEVEKQTANTESSTPRETAAVSLKAAMKYVDYTMSDDELSEMLDQTCVDMFIGWTEGEFIAFLRDIKKANGDYLAVMKEHKMISENEEDK